MRTIVTASLQHLKPQGTILTSNKSLCLIRGCSSVLHSLLHWSNFVNDASMLFVHWSNFVNDASILYKYAFCIDVSLNAANVSKACHGSFRSVYWP